MALIMIDGFDEYVNGPTKYLGGLQGSNNLTGTISRTGRGCWSTSGPNGPYTSFTTRTTLIQGVAVFPSDPIAGSLFLWVRNGVQNINTRTNLQIYLNADGSVSAVNGEVPFQTTLGQSGPAKIIGGVYNYIECKCFSNATTGTVEIKVNGALVLSLTNVNTDPYGLTGFDTAELGGPTGGLAARFDDMYLADTLGGVNNDFLGAIRVYTALPVSDNTPLQWTPSTGTPHFSLVNGVPAESQTTYVSDTGLGNTDQYLYDLTSIPAGVQILGVQHGLYTELDAAGSGSVGSSCGGIVAGSQAVTTSPHIYSFVRDTDPVAVGPWTMANLINRQFGPNRTA